MTEHVVDFLEPVEVDAQNGEAGLAGRGLLERVREMLIEGGPVGQVVSESWWARYAMRASARFRSVTSSTIVNRYCGFPSGPIRGTRRDVTIRSLPLGVEIA
jgi:hypothetical protein